MITNSINPKFHTQVPYRHQNPMVSRQSALESPTFGAKNLTHLAQNAASVSAQAGVKILSESEKEDLRMVKEVFEPLSKFKGTNEEFFSAAYEKVLKFRQLDDVAPRVFKDELQNPDTLGVFSFTDGALVVNTETLDSLSKGDIIEFIDHELEHCQRYGDVAREMGVQRFAQQGEELINAQIRNRIAKEPDTKNELKEISNGNKAYLNTLKTLEHKDLVAELSRADSPKEKIQRQKFLGEYFPEGLVNLDKKEIILRVKEIQDVGKEMILYSKAMERGRIIEVNRDFWHNYLSKNKAPLTQKEQIGPFVENFAHLINTKPPKGRYNEFCDDRIYMQNPFEQTAWARARHTKALWADFTKKNGIRDKKEFMMDIRENIGLFDKIDKMLSVHLSDKRTRGGAFNEIYFNAYDNLAKNGERINNHRILKEMVKEIKNAKIVEE